MSKLIYGMHEPMTADVMPDGLKSFKVLFTD